MNVDYLTPTVEQVPLMVEQAICTASTTFSGGDYTLVPDEFDTDSD